VIETNRRDRRAFDVILEEANGGGIGLVIANDRDYAGTCLHYFEMRASDLNHECEQIGSGEIRIGAGTVRCLEAEPAFREAGFADVTVAYNTTADLPRSRKAKTSQLIWRDRRA